MQTVFVAIAACLMAVWLGLAVMGPPRMETSNAVTVLRYGMIWRLLALAFAMAPLLIFLYAVWKFHWATPAKFNLAAAAFLTFSVIIGLWLIEVARVQIVLTEEGITRSSPWSGLATLRWTDIASVRYSAANRWFVVAGAGRTIRLSRYLGGISAFAHVIERKVMGEKWASAAEALTATK